MSTASADPSKTSKKSALAVVYLTVFIDLLGFGIILPLLPFYAQQFGATGIWVGVLMTAYSAAQFLGAPIIGRLSDRYGRRPLLLVTLAGSAVSMTIAGSAGSLVVLLAARLCAGLFGGSIAAAQAYIADVTTSEERSKYMGILGATIGLGFVFGPALGGTLSRYGFGTAAYVAAGLAAVNFVWALVKLPESRAGTGPRGHFSLRVIASGFAAPSVRPILLATFGVTFAFVAMETTYALLSAARFGLDSRQLGYVFTFLGVVVVIVQGGLVGRLARRLGEGRLARLGCLVMAVGLVALPFAPTLIISVALLGVLAAGQGFASPSLATLLSRSAGSDEQGALLGLGQSLAALARAVGPLLAGLLYDVAQPAPYLAAGCSCVLAALVVSTMLRRPAAAVPVAG